MSDTPKDHEEGAGSGNAPEYRDPTGAPGTRAAARAETPQGEQVPGERHLEHAAPIDTQCHARPRAPSSSPPAGLRAALGRRTAARAPTHRRRPPRPDAGRPAEPLRADRPPPTPRARAERPRTGPRARMPVGRVRSRARAPQARPDTRTASSRHTASSPPMDSPPTASSTARAGLRALPLRPAAPDQHLRDRAADHLRALHARRLHLRASPRSSSAIMALVKQDESPAESAKFTRWGWIAYAVAVALVVVLGIAAIAIFASMDYNSTRVLNRVPDGPLIVQSDKTLLLEVDHPRAEEARRAIAPFAELERAPEHMHTYRVTPLGLWNARAAGHDAEQVVNALITLQPVCRAARAARRRRRHDGPLRPAHPAQGRGARPGAAHHRPTRAGGGVCGTGRSSRWSARASTTTGSSCTPRSGATSSRSCSRSAGRLRTRPATSTARPMPSTSPRTAGRCGPTSSRPSTGSGTAAPAWWSSPAGPARPWSAPGRWPRPRPRP